MSSEEKSRLCNMLFESNQLPPTGIVEMNVCRVGLAHDKE